MSDTKDDGTTGEQLPVEGSAKAQRRLTMKMIEKLSTDRPGGIRVYEGHGFCVQVMPSGHKSFMLDYTSPTTRQRRRMRLGTLADMNLAQARDAASEAHRKIRRGIDPQEEREQERAAGSFGDWVARYLAAGQAEHRWTLGSLRSIRSLLRRAVTAFGKKQLGSVTARDVEILRDETLRKSGLGAANTMVSTVKACLAEAWRRGLVQSNPAALVKRISGQMPRTRTLSEDEMRRLIDAVEAHPEPVFRVALLWLALTGARRSEVLRATWGDLRLDPPDRAEWTLPRTKGGVPGVRPIPAQLALEIVALPRQGLRIVPFGDTAFAKKWTRLREAAGLPKDVHLHDLRRTAGLWLTRAAGLQVAQRLLGHSDIGTTARVYAPLSTDDLRGPQAEVVGKVLAFRKEAEKK
jgi:integrase